MQFLAMGAGAVGIASALSRGKESEAQYKAQAAANEFNAAVARQRATTVRQLGKYQADSILGASSMQEEQQRRSGGFAKGTRQAAAAQSGTGTDEGSNADVERQSMILSELDALNIRYAGQLNAHDTVQNAEYNAHDLETGATMDMWSAQVNRNSAKYAVDSSYLGAMGSLFSAGAMYAGSQPGGGTGMGRPRMSTIYSNDRYGIG